jgi:hypothetical protein
MAERGLLCESIASTKRQIDGSELAFKGDLSSDKNYW